MRRYSLLTCRLISAILLVSLSSWGYSQEVGRGLGTTRPAPPPPEPVIEQEAPKTIPPTDSADSAPRDLGSDSERIDTLIERMALEEKIAQLMFVRLNGEFTLDPADQQLLSKIPPGGVLLPTIGYAFTAVDRTQSIAALISRTPHRIPYFIAGEGFETSDRAAADANRFMQVPSLMSIGAAGISDDTKLLFDSMADDVKRLGINTHFGPTLSLSPALSNHTRDVGAFGDRPEATSKFATELFGAFSEHRVLWMPTGFPGGELNRVGTQPAVMLTPGKYYIERDGLPYLRAIQHGAPMMHVGNTLTPTIDDSAYPASISRKVISTLLRGSLNYDGLVVAGPIDTTYMLSKFEPATSAALSLSAGADMILWSRVSPQIVKVISLVANAVRTGELEEALIDRAVRRVLETKMAYGLFDAVERTDKDVRKLQRENRKNLVTQEVERQSITLLKNERNTLPLLADTSTPVLLAGVLELEDIRYALEKKLKSKAVYKFEAKMAKHISRVQDFEIRRLTRITGGLNTAVCIFDERLDPKSQSEIIDTLKTGNSRVVVVLLGQPDTMEAYKNADAILLTYGTSNIYGHMVQSILDILLGEAPIRILSSETPLVRATNEEIIFNVLDVIQSPVGQLPIDLPPYFSHGDSVSYRPTSIKKVRWEFGDGKQSRDEEVGYTYKKPGDYLATLTITDNAGRETTGTFPISIQNREQFVTNG